MTKTKSNTDAAYEVIDGKTQEVVGRYNTLRKASRRADKLDNIYGGHRYHFRPIGGYAALKEVAQ